MPNYSLNTTGAQFKPFSFQEIIAPYEMMRTAEEKLQNDYIQMSDQVGEWQAAVESSPTLSARLQNYQDKVRAASDKLAATGKLDRGAFFELRKQMTAQIAPIKKAVTEYNKAIELDTKMRAADGTYIAKRQVPTLEDFANGDNRYSGGISGNTVLTRAAAAGKELSKEQRAVIDSFTNDGAFVKMSQETGIPVEQLTLQAIRSGNAPKEVLDVYNSLRDSIGYNDYDQTGKDMIDSNIQLGLLSASTERREAFQRNPHDEWVSSYQKQRDELEDNQKERQIKLTAASQGFYFDDNGNPIYDPDTALQIYTAKGAAKGETKADKEASKTAWEKTGGNLTTDVGTSNIVKEAIANSDKKGLSAKEIKVNGKNINVLGTDNMIYTISQDDKGNWSLDPTAYNNTPGINNQNQQSSQTETNLKDLFLALAEKLAGTEESKEEDTKPETIVAPWATMYGNKQ